MLTVEQRCITTAPKAARRIIPIPLISSIVPPIPSPARKNCRLLRPLYHDQGPAYPDSGHHPHGQHLRNFQSGGVYGKGALCLPVPADGSGQRCQAKAEQGQKRIAELDTIIKSSMNPLLSDASPMNALTVCWRITKPSRKRCKFLSQKRKKGCPLSQRTVPVWSSFWSWQGSIPIFLS